MITYQFFSECNSIKSTKSIVKAKSIKSTKVSIQKVLTDQKGTKVLNVFDYKSTKGLDRLEKYKSIVNVKSIKNTKVFIQKKISVKMFLMLLQERL